MSEGDEERCNCRDGNKIHSNDVELVKVMDAEINTNQGPIMVVVSCEDDDIDCNDLSKRLEVVETSLYIYSNI